ncbi:hypothetical protein [Aureibacter tunicatorum]|uniref:Uncharacterized protein n=1 Tax=Aureibacter tunicatorum TaxID=866807 RepID=A0AAE3XQT0_9BACT|nr:hypothetical protein [Aureibacter tunicatorum]MDR6240240.1 hypothetical protein [Aureibacter tunicatorum]BDD05879.1 hypothetical protein AUTU_33620 [Aureibacter tunicatorum]
MIKDIKVDKVSGVSVAIAYELNKAGDKEWNVYLINNNDFAIETVLISTKGYGEVNGEERKTTTLRHKVDELDSGCYVKVEPIQESLFELNNEFWVSYFYDGKMLDKRFIFPAGMIIEPNIKEIPEIGLKGIYSFN